MILQTILFFMFLSGRLLGMENHNDTSNRQYDEVTVTVYNNFPYNDAACRILKLSPTDKILEETSILSVLRHSRYKDSGPTSVTYVLHKKDDGFEKIAITYGWCEITKISNMPVYQPSGKTDRVELMTAAMFYSYRQNQK